MVMTSPQIATTNSAPAESRTSRTGMMKSLGAPLASALVVERILRLGDADRQIAEAHLSKLASWSLTDLGASISWPGRSSGRWYDLFQERHVVGIKRLELRLAALGHLDHRAGNVGRALAAHRPMVGHQRLDAELAQASLTSAISASVSAEKRLMETTGTRPKFCMFSTCRCRLAMPTGERLGVFLLEVLFLDAAVHLERADGGDQHHRVGRKPGLAALDVDEFLGAEIGAETRFGHYIVGELERGGGGHHRIAAMRDVGEGAAMDEGGRAFQRLHQVGRQRVLQAARSSGPAP